MFSLLLRSLHGLAVTTIFLLILAAAPAASGQCASQTVTASDAAAGEIFGNSVSLDGTRALVAAQFDGENGLEAGAAYVFELGGPSWAEQAKLTASDGEAGDAFGADVALDGDVAVIGARNDDSTGTAYVFRFNVSAWVEETKLIPSDGEAGDSFGRAVAIHGNVAVVGAWREGGPLSNSGAAYVYRYDGLDWIEEDKLTASDAGDLHGFGFTVAIDGDVIVIGAWGNDVIGPLAGAAYVFRYDGVSWLEEAILMASDEEAFDSFGWSVAVSGGVAVVGSNHDDDVALDAGAAYVFRHDGSTWIEEQKLTANDGAAMDYFGDAVAIDANVAVVTTAYDDDLGLDSGAAYIFRFSGSWGQDGKLTAADGAAEDNYGIAAALSGERVAIGALNADGAGMNAGAAYLYTLTGCGGGGGFSRGDCNADGGYDISDAVNALAILFSGSGPAPCDDACDANDDGTFDISDPIFVLAGLFSMGPDPTLPFPGCGPDPTADALGCVSFPPCP